jgi:hypothetical protein
MAKPTDQPPTQQSLAGLIDEALGARQMLPPYERCMELNRALRAAIGDLYLAVQEQARQAPAHSRDWHRLHGLLTDVDDTLTRDLGAGLLSAAIQLGALARHCRNLDAETP